MQDLGSRARAVRIAFWLLIAVYAAEFLSDGSLLLFVRDLRAGVVPEPTRADAIDLRQAVLGAVQIALNLACAVAFLRWFAQSHRNLAAAGASGLVYTPGWAVGGFFVPLVNLFLPYRVMREVWSVSAARAGRPPGRPALVGWWWVFFLGSAALNVASGYWMTHEIELDELLEAAHAMLASDLLNIASTGLALRVVARVTELQRVAAEEQHA